MFEIGRWCMKIAGRDGGLKCIVIDVLDDRFVLIDGQTRRKKCNIFHLEPLPKVSEIAKNASHAVVVKLFEQEGIELKEKKAKEPPARPKVVRKAKPVEKPVEKKKKPAKK